MVDSDKAQMTKTNRETRLPNGFAQLVSHPCRSCVNPFSHDSDGNPFPTHVTIATRQEDAARLEGGLVECLKIVGRHGFGIGCGAVV